MTQQLINIGTTANDGTGDNLRTAFNKTNENFTDLYTQIAATYAVESDTTPSLGGDLDVNGFEIITADDGDIVFNPDGAGAVIIDNVSIKGTTIQAVTTNSPLVLRANGTGAIDLLNVSVTGGTIDGVNIGATTRGSGAFTTLSSNGLTILGLTSATAINNTPIGNTIPAAGAFTTLSASGTTTLSGSLTAASINATVIGNSTPAAGTFTTLSASGVATMSNSTNSTSTSTGALIVTGGVGIGGNLFVGGNIDVTGNVVIGGNISLGDANTDIIQVNADLGSTLLPDAELTYDLGSNSKRWRTLYIDQIQGSGVAFMDIKGDVIGADSSLLVDYVNSLIKADIDNTNQLTTRSEIGKLHLGDSGYGAGVNEDYNLEVEVGNIRLGNITIDSSSTITDLSGSITFDTDLVVGNVTTTGSITATDFYGNVTGNVIGSAGTASYVTEPVQSNIVSLGTLISVVVSGPAVLNDFYISGDSILNTVTDGNIVITPNGSGIIAHSSDTEFRGDLLADIDGTYDIGTAAFQFKDLYLAGKISFNGAEITESGGVLDIPAGSTIGGLPLASASTGNIVFVDNEISTFNTDEDIILTPNGGGIVDIQADVNVTGAISGGNISGTEGNFTDVTADTITSTTNDLNIATINNGNISLTPNGTGLVKLGAPSSIEITGGVFGYVLSTDGSGNLSWIDQAVPATGNIRFVTNSITTLNTNEDMIIDPNGTGKILPGGDNTTDFGASGTRWANVYATSLYGTLATAAQTNITSVGTLSSLTISGDLAVNGADITTTATGTATLFNTNATTLNIGGAATTMNIGAAAGNVTFAGNVTVASGKYVTVPHLNVNTSIDVSGGVFLNSLTIINNAVTVTTTNLDLDLYANGTGMVHVNDDLRVTGNVYYNNANPTIQGNVGNITISTVSGNIALTPGGGGYVTVSGIRFPTADGTSGQVLATNGSGVLSFVNAGTGNLLISDNVISSVNGNADIELTPNGTGDVKLNADTVRVGDSGAAVTLTTNGAGNLTINTNSGTNSSSIAIANGTNGNITAVLNGTGTFNIDNVVVSDNKVTTLNTDGDLEITPNGAGVVMLGRSSPNVSGGILQIKSGITFPATQVASSDANTLDDYEEGTWTPVFRFGGSDTGFGYDANNGYYVKIGKTVWLQFYIDLNTKGSNTGVTTITNLPFAIGSESSSFAQGNAAKYTGFTSVSGIHFDGVPGASTINVYYNAAGDSTAVDNTHFTNNSRLQGTIVYRAAA